MRILVVTRSYPAPRDLYQYPFVHRRVLAYAAASHDVAVFRPAAQAGLTSHLFDTVTCHSGDAGAFQEFVAGWQPTTIAAHGFSEQMWPWLEPVSKTIPILAWLHGSEIPEFFRRKAVRIADPAARAKALDAVRKRCDFWIRFLGSRPALFRLVFVSNSAVELARQDFGEMLGARDFTVIPNPIDTDLFAYQPKAPEDRLRILMIRPFDSLTYGNDLAVSAILRLAGRKGFDRLRFTIIGDGPLFDETLRPLSGLAEVRVERRFLTQAEIAAEHRRHGIFLVPTRLDTQGVSRDEAMASGLVPVTNLIPAVAEFTDATCAGLAPPDDANGLAEVLWAMNEDPALFLRRSQAAAERVRRQSGHRRIIAAELDLLEEAALV